MHSTRPADLDGPEFARLHQVADRASTQREQPGCVLDGVGDAIQRHGFRAISRVVRGFHATQRTTWHARHVLILSADLYPGPAPYRELMYVHSAARLAERLIRR